MTKIVIELEPQVLNLLILAAREALSGRVDSAWWEARRETSRALLELELYRLDEIHMQAVEQFVLPFMN